MQITVLGSGLTATYPGLKYRFPASHLVETGQEKILLDVSVGTLPQLAKLGVEPTDITTICISHYHTDHFAIEPFLQALFVLNFASGKNTNLRILGPSDIEESVKAGYRLKGWTFEDDLLKKVDITFLPYQDGQPIEVDSGVTVTPFVTKHLSLEAYALRVESDGSVLAYSGDSGVTPGLEAAAAKSNIFLCEAAYDVGTPANHIHVSPKEAGMIAQKAQCERLVLVHYSGNDKPEAMISDAKALGFTGGVEVAEDLSVYN